MTFGDWFWDRYGSGTSDAVIMPKKARKSLYTRAREAVRDFCQGTSEFLRYGPLGGATHAMDANPSPLERSTEDNPEAVMGVGDFCNAVEAREAASVEEPEPHDTVNAGSIWDTPSALNPKD